MKSPHCVVELTLHNIILCMTTPERKAFENMGEKGQNAGNQPAFILFHTMYSTLSVKFHNLGNILAHIYYHTLLKRIEGSHKC